MLASASNRLCSSADLASVTSWMIVAVAKIAPASSVRGDALSSFHFTMPSRRWTIRISSGSAGSPRRSRTDGTASIVSGSPSSSRTT